MTKKQEARELTFVEAQFEEVRQFLADMATSVEDLAISVGSLAEDEVEIVDQYGEDVIVSDEDKERAQDISTQLYGLLESVTSVHIDDSPDVATKQATHDEYGYPVAQG